MRAFTLIELLLAIAIIAVLLALLLPPLSHAQRSGRDAVCLSNLKGIGAAFTMYDMDYDAFPRARRHPHEWPSDHSYRFGWGGVHHYGLDSHGRPHYPDDVPLQLLAGVRPLNPYVGREVINQARDEVWQCPNDDGILQPAGDKYEVNTDPWYHFNPQDHDAGTVYAFTGNSYECNPNLYVASIHNLTLLDRGLRDVEHFSLFVLAGDTCGMTLARSGVWNDAMIQGYWHYKNRCQFAFGDGSAGIRWIVSDKDEHGHVEPTTRNGYTFALR